MSETRTVEIVKNAFAAFQRGDIDGVLALVADDVEWHAVKGADAVAPHGGLRRGRAGVVDFFAKLGESTTFSRFEPREFIAQDDQVAAIGDYTCQVKDTGGSVASDWVMVFTIRDGKIARFREWTDSAQVVRAYGAMVTA